MGWADVGQGKASGRRGGDNLITELLHVVSLEAGKKTKRGRAEGLQVKASIFSDSHLLTSETKKKRLQTEELTEREKREGEECAFFNSKHSWRVHRCRFIDLQRSYQ